MAENTLELPTLFACLEEYGKAVADLYRRKLLARDKVTKYSGKLTNTLKSVVTHGGGTFEVSLSLQDYWKYVERGRKPGKWPPRSAILQWIRVKPVAPYPGRDGRVPSENQLAFLIARKIGTKGIAPTPALAETLEELNASWLPRIEAAFGEDAAAWVEKYITLTQERV